MADDHLERPPHDHNLSYRPDIDGLRALAVLPVVAFHAFPGRVPGGFVGVDIFFVISGFLISSILIREMRCGSYSLARFYVRRIRRIFPALVIVLVATLAIGRALLLSSEIEQLAKHVVTGALFAANFGLWNEAGYFDVSSDFKPLLHLWSLGVEEQFYIVWPIALALLFRLGGRLTLAIVAAAAASFLLNIFIVADNAVMAFYFPLTRFWELLLGATLASMTFLPRSRLLADLLSSTGIGLILASIAIINVDVPYPGWWALLPVAGALCIIAAGPEAWGNRHLLGNRIAVWFGLISYPLYLWHWPLLSFLRITDPIPTENGQRLTRLAAIALSIFLAWATYRLVELKVRRRKPPAYVGRLVSAMAAICVVAVLSYVAAARSDHATASAFDWDKVRFASPACFEKYALRPSASLFCVETDPELPPSVLVIGDSHANHWVPGIKAQDGRGILNIGEGGCPYFERVRSQPRADGYSQDCEHTMARAFAVLRGTPSITSVVLSSQVSAIIPGPAYGSLAATPRRVLHLEGMAVSNEAIYAQELRRTLMELTRLGKQVTFVLQVPELGFNPTECVRLRPTDFFKDVRIPCSVKRADVERRQERYRTIAKDILESFPAVRVLDPFSVICTANTCDAQQEGVFLYRDNDHMTVPGSVQVWQGMTFH